MAKSQEYMRRYRASKAAAMGAGGNDIIRDGLGNEADLSTNAWWRSLAIGIPESQRKDLYYHSGMQESTISQMSDDAKYSYAKYEAVTVNESLPQIQGTSQKQIDYAESVRARVIANEIQRAHERVKKIPKDRLQAEFDRVGARSLSEYITMAMKMNPNSAYNKYKNMATAREILDNR